MPGCNRLRAMVLVVDMAEAACRAILWMDLLCLGQRSPRLPGTAIMASEAWVRMPTSAHRRRKPAALNMAVALAQTVAVLPIMARAEVRYTVVLAEVLVAGLTALERGAQDTGEPVEHAVHTFLVAVGLKAQTHPQEDLGRLAHPKAAQTWLEQVEEAADLARP